MKNAKTCYICKEKFEYKYLKDKKYRKVRHYCHYTREYRDAAHSICNLKELQTINIYWFYLLHNHVDTSTKSK